MTIVAKYRCSSYELDDDTDDELDDDDDFDQDDDFDRDDPDEDEDEDDDEDIETWQVRRIAHSR
jgi:hypothetical protein